MNDIVPLGISQDSHSQDPLDFTLDVVEQVLKSSLEDMCSCVNDVAAGCSQICHGNFRSGGNMITHRVTKGLAGTMTAVDSAVSLAESTGETICNGTPFMTDSNKQHLVNVGRFALFAGLAGTLLSEGK